MFSFGEKFKELWSLIPTIVTHRNYVEIANAIDDAYTGNEITERDESALSQALKIFCTIRQVSMEDPEY